MDARILKRQAQDVLLGRAKIVTYKYPLQAQNVKNGSIKIVTHKYPLRNGRSSAARAQTKKPKVGNFEVAVGTA